MAIAVPVADTIVSVPDFGKPVADWINAQTATSWVTLTLQNSWVTAGQAGPLQYRKIGDVVYLRGQVNGGANNSVIATLPAGYRPPPAQLNFVCYHWPSLPSSCMVVVASDGTIRAQMLDGKTGAPQYVDLSLIQFATV